jgi:hypothetical protein
MPETPSPSLTASMAEALGLSLPGDQAAALAVEQAVLRCRADGLRPWLGPGDEPGPLDLRPVLPAANVPPGGGPASPAASDSAARDRARPGSGGQ